MRFRLKLRILAGVLGFVAACASPNFDDGSSLPPLSDAPATGKPVTGQATDTSPVPSGSGSAMPLQPAPSSSAGSPFDDAGVGTAPFDAGPQAKRWKGSLASAFPVDFGGGSACNFRITLTSITVDITAASNGDMVAANVTTFAIEQVLSDPCVNVAIPAHTQRFALTNAMTLGNGKTHLELSPLASNKPPASLVIEGDFSAASPVLALQWHRTDFGPPLDWTVNAHVTMQLQ